MALENLLPTNAYDPDVTLLSDGGRLLLFSSNDASLRGIWAQRYDSAGEPVGDIYQINSQTAGYQTQPETIVLADGSMVVSWVSGSSINDADESVGTFRAQRLDAEGHLIGDEFAINPTTTAAWSRGVELAPLQDGGFVAVWYSYTSATADRSIYAQRFDASGTVIGGEFRVAAGTGDEAEVTALADGGFVVTWSSGRGLWGTDTAGGIFGQRYDANGAAVGAEFHVNTTTPDEQEQSQLLAMNDGGFVVFWLHDGNPQDIRFQRYDAAGATVGVETVMETGVPISHSGAKSNDWKVIALDGGGVAMLWRDTNQGEMKIQSFDMNGAAITDVAIISTENIIGNGPHFTADLDQLANGELLVTWENEPLDEIYTQTLDAPPVSMTQIDDFMFDV